MSQGTARCRSVRKPAAYQARPGGPECKRVGRKVRIEESKVTPASWKQGATRAGSTP